MEALIRSGLLLLSLVPWTAEFRKSPLHFSRVWVYVRVLGLLGFLGFRVYGFRV